MATQIEKILQKSKDEIGKSYKDSSGMTYCQRFVRICYEAAGIKASAPSAKAAGDNWIISSSKSNIPVGATVYFTNNNQYGHVGIYIGNNKMRHVWSKGKVQETSIDVASGYRGWGWHGGKEPTGTVASKSPNSNNSYSKKYLGKYKITAYCPCSKCCGKWANGITATGVKAQANHTIAVDPKVIPYGSKVMFDNKIYYAEDCGGAIKDKKIDLYFNTHREALNWGVQYKDVYLVTGDVSNINSNTGEVPQPPITKNIQWTKSAKSSMKYLIVHTAVVPAKNGNKAAVNSIINILKSKGLSVQGIVTPDGVTQTAAWDTACDQCKNANSFSCGLEAPESPYISWTSSWGVTWDKSHDADVKEYHEKLYDMQVRIYAWLAQKYNISVQNIISHAEASAKWNKGGHGDPDNMWACFKKAWNDNRWTMNAFRNAVSQLMTSASSNTTDSTSSTTSEKAELCSTSIISTVNFGSAVKDKQYLNLATSGIEYELNIVNKGINYIPLAIGEVKWTTEWCDVAGKLEFTILKDNNLNVTEGNTVIFRYKGQDVFYGYLFSKKKDKDGEIKCVAYDQLRYFKNKDTYCYVDRSYTDLVKQIANDNRLIVADDITDTNYRIASRIEDDTSYFNMCQYARKQTMYSTGEIYILYDDFGKLNIKKIEELATDYLLNEKTAENFDFSTSIDDGVYSQIQLFKDDDTTGNRAKYIYRSGDAINDWGVLQTTINVDVAENFDYYGERLIKLYSDKKKELKIKSALGDVRLRAGSSIFVSLDVGDFVYKNDMFFVTTAKHKFSKNGGYTVDLELAGQDKFVGSVD